MQLKLILILLSLIIPSGLVAQEVTIHLVNAGSGELQNDKVNLTYYIGEFIDYDEEELPPDLEPESYLGKIIIYPNPVHSILRIESTIPDLKEYLLFNLTGFLVKRFDAMTREMDFSNLPAGVYFLKIQDKYERNLTTLKVIKD